MLYPIELGVPNSFSGRGDFTATAGVGLGRSTTDKRRMFGLWLDGSVYEMSADNLGGILPRYFHLGARQGGSVGERLFARLQWLERPERGLIRKTLPRCSAAVSHRYRDCHFFREVKLCHVPAEDSLALQVDNAMVSAAGGAGLAGKLGFLHEEFCPGVERGVAALAGAGGGAAVFAGRGGPVGREHRRPVSDHRNHAPRPVAADLEPKATGEAQADLAAHEAELAAGEARRRGGDRPSDADLNVQLDVLRTRVRIDRASVSTRLSGCSRFSIAILPAKPFSTVVFIVTLVAIATGAQAAPDARQHDARLVRVAEHCPRYAQPDFRQGAMRSTGRGSIRRASAAFAAHITHTTDMLAGGITNFYGGAVTEPLRILSCLFGAWFISWRLTLASLIFAPLAAFLMLHLNRRIRGLSLRILDRSMGFHHVMLEVFNVADHRAGQHDGRLRAQAVSRSDRPNSAAPPCRPRFTTR